jgi:hypothetical protein
VQVHNKITNVLWILRNRMANQEGSLGTFSPSVI